MNFEEYYEMQKTNLDYPNEEYINSEDNINKADLYRFNFVYENNRELQGKMLDVGCNDGFFMRNYNWKFEKYLGVDMFSISEYTHGKYDEKKELYTKNGKIEYFTGLIEELEVENDEYDFIFAGEILEHVLDEHEFLKIIQDKVKQGGRVVFTTPNNVGGNHREHLRQFKKSELEMLLTQYFEKVDIVILPSINGAWASLYAKCESKRK